MTTKYHVMLINCDYSVKILFTTNTLSDCHLFISEHIKEKFNVDGKFVKAHHDDETTISIYNYHYIMPKSLKCKLMIVSYPDLYERIDDN